jgi:glycosyltransferase involved in cell wall biosynthesis
VRFVLAGDGELRRPLEEQAARLGLGCERLLFVGWRDDVPELLRFFDLFVCSSIEEGLNGSVIQALALRKPVVVTAAGGMPEVVTEGRHGLVVPPANPAELAGAVAALLKDRPRAETMAEAGSRHVRRRFTIEQMVEGTLATYRRVLEEPGE